MAYTKCNWNSENSIKILRLDELWIVEYYKLQRLIKQEGEYKR